MRWARRAGCPAPHRRWDKHTRATTGSVRPPGHFYRYGRVELEGRGCSVARPKAPPRCGPTPMRCRTPRPSGQRPTSPAVAPPPAGGEGRRRQQARVDHRHLAMSARAVVRRAPEAPGRGRRVAWSRWLCEAPARALPIQAPHRARLAARPSAPWWMAHGGLPTHGSREADTQRHHDKSVHGPYQHPTILRAYPRSPPPGSTAPTTDRTAQARDGPRPDRTSSTNGPLSNPSPIVNLCNSPRPSQQRPTSATWHPSRLPAVVANQPCQ